MKQLALLLLCTACTCNYDCVENAALMGNPYAQELLLAGYNKRSGEIISETMLQRAMSGDKVSMDIIKAQLYAGNTMPAKIETRTVVVPMPVPSRAR